MVGYIGRSPQIGGYHKLDAITTDGSASYTMQLNSGNFVPESANHLIVSVNGVIQAPTDSFTVSGSTITFASSLSVSDTIDFIMALGNTLDIGVPSDSTVSLSKLTATGTKDSTTFLRGDNTFAVPAGGVNTPSFEAYLSSGQSISDSVATKVQFNTERFDTDSCYDNSTNYRFTPTTAGKYFVYSNVQHRMSGYDIYVAKTMIYKNGSQHCATNTASNTSSILAHPVTISAIIDMNGSSDYIEIFGFIAGHGGGGNSFDAGTANCYFGAFRIIE